MTEKMGFDVRNWSVKKIAVIGPGIVGMPMAALLAHARIKQGDETPAKVMVLQRNSKNSGWKVDAINSGQSPIGGIEPDLDRIVAQTVSEGLLSASHDYAELADADVILVCVQTDKKGLEPDYGPLFSSLTDMTRVLANGDRSRKPLIIFESTLAPSTMNTVIKEFFAQKGLVEGKNILLGNSPNRVMPGRLVQRVAASDKIVAGLSPETPVLVQKLYNHIVSEGTLYKTNSMTAEVVKTLENAYRDVRIAFAAEIVRYCDQQNINFFDTRDRVNSLLAQTDAASSDPNAVPSGGILVPGVGVGGHCLPKDGILLWWRRLERCGDADASLILESRRINDESPKNAIDLFEREFEPILGKSIALFGAAYRFNSEDTRNSPTLQLALQLIDKNCDVKIHDPYVKPDDQNLTKFGLQGHFTRSYAEALASSEYLIFCTAHKVYLDNMAEIKKLGTNLKGIMDGCNLAPNADLPGIGRGTQPPSDAFIRFVYDSFRIVETGIANELTGLIDFLNQNYATDDFNKVRFDDVKGIAGTCVTGCQIADPAPITAIPVFGDFSLRLTRCAAKVDFHQPAPLDSEFMRHVA